MLGYANPVKSFKVSGISSTKLKNRFAKRREYNTSLRSDAKAGFISVSAASGWKITSVEWYGNSESRNFYFSGVPSAKMAVPKMKKSAYNSISVTFKNTTTQATQVISYNLYE